VLELQASRRKDNTDRYTVYKTPCSRIPALDFGDKRMYCAVEEKRADIKMTGLPFPRYVWPMTIRQSHEAALCNSIIMRDVGDILNKFRRSNCKRVTRIEVSQLISGTTAFFGYKGEEILD